MRAADFFARHHVFTHDEFAAARAQDGAENRATTNTMLAKHVASGGLVRVRRGVYATASRGGGETAVDPFLVAAKLAPDAALAYHAALQFHGKAYSVWHRFTVLTRAHLRPLEFQGNEFVGVSPPKSVLPLAEFGGGIAEQSYLGEKVRVTTLERTLVDVLDVPSRGGGWEEIWRSLESVEYFDLEAVVDYALKLDSALTTARVGFYLEQHREALFVEEKHLKPLLDGSPRQVRYLAKEKRGGTLVQRWNLIVPESILRRSWEEAADAIA